MRHRRIRALWLRYVTATLSRPLGVPTGQLNNTATLDSTNAFLKDLSGGNVLSDDARELAEGVLEELDGA